MPMINDKDSDPSSGEDMGGSSSVSESIGGRSVSESIGGVESCLFVSPSILPRKIEHDAETGQHHQARDKEETRKKKHKNKKHFKVFCMKFSLAFQDKSNHLSGDLISCRCLKMPSMMWGNELGSR